MAKLADAADFKSVALRWVWGFKSPSGHQSNRRYVIQFNFLNGYRDVLFLKGNRRISSYSGRGFDHLDVSRRLNSREIQATARQVLGDFP